jgi:hypothetical protein
MNQFLDTLNNMKDMPIVRFFSQFFTEARLAPMVGSMKARLAGGTGGSLAKELLVWAIVLAIGTFIIDQVFYWTSPGQVERARENWHGFTSGVQSIGVSARLLADRARGGFRKAQVQARGRR